MAKRKEDEGNVESSLDDYIMCGTFEYKFKKPWIDGKTGELKGQGLLPQMLAGLLSERKLIKKEMDKAVLTLKMNSGKASKQDR